MDSNNQVFQKSPKYKTKLDEFWSFCKKLYQNTSTISPGINLETYRDEFEIKSRELYSKIQSHKQFLERVPLIVPLRNWLDEQISSCQCGEELLNYIKALIETQIIPTHDAAGRMWDLELQRQYGHEKIIEDIRCTATWTASEKEKIVSFYLMFAQHLATVTFGFVTYEGDPDRIKTSRRILPFEVYLDFVSQLAERDALIAAILYYGGISVTEVLSLKVSQIAFHANSIHFQDEVITYPHHVINRLQAFVQGKQPDELTFANRSGEEVNRSRLFRNFKNASANMSSPRDISPAILIESRVR